MQKLFVIVSLLLLLLFTSISNTIIVDAKDRFSFGETRGVVDLDDALLALTLAEVEARLGGVGDDVPADGLLVVAREEGRVGVGDDLVGDDDGGAVFLGQTLEGTEELAELLLAISELAAAGEVGAEERGGGVDDDDSKSVLSHHCGRLGEKLLLMFAVVGAGAGDVVEDVVGVEAEALGDGAEALGTEGAFGVDVEGHAFGAALVEGKLAGDAERVAELRLAGSELAEELGDGAGLEAAAEELVEFLGAGCDADEVLSHHVDVGGAGEADGAELLRLLDEGVGLLVADALAVDDDLLGGVGDALDGVDTALDQRLDVGALEAVLLEDLDAARIGSTGNFDVFLFVTLLLLSSGVVGRDGGLLIENLEIVIGGFDFLDLGATATLSGFGGHCCFVFVSDGKK